MQQSYLIFRRCVDVGLSHCKWNMWQGVCLRVWLNFMPRLRFLPETICGSC